MLSLISNRRVFVGEIMDSPTIDATDHLRALAGLRRINEVSGAADEIGRPIINLVQRAKLKRISLLDIACGGGDVPLAMARSLQHKGIEVELNLLDRSGTALAQAASVAQAAGIACKTFESDALDCSRMEKVDVVTNSLFLHHLRAPEEVTDVLRNMRTIARRMVVISDLRRSTAGYLGAWVGCRLLSRSQIVHHDGPASARAAWTVGELKAMAEKAGMQGVTVQKCFPWRMLLVWEGTP
jgi:2-polyprenyl-3-methyl-5-hydroxy-6-metoxy-1,4-benzoquinol methylase